MILMPWNPTHPPPTTCPSHHHHCLASLEHHCLPPTHHHLSHPPRNSADHALAVPASLSVCLLLHSATSCEVWPCRRKGEGAKAWEGATGNAYINCLFCLSRREGHQLGAMKYRSRKELTTTRSQSNVRLFVCLLPDEMI